MARFHGISGMAIAVARAAQSWAARMADKADKAAEPKPTVKVKRRPYIRPRDGFLSMAMGPRQQALVWRRHRQRLSDAATTLDRRELLNRFGKPHQNAVRGATHDRRHTNERFAARHPEVAS